MANAASFPQLPTPPEWALDWNALVARFAWLRAMAGVPQDPVYHAEGDVLTHTCMVVAATIASLSWRQASANERALRFAAALLHDVAKPVTTREEEGHIVSPGHARRGELMARALLYAAEGLETPLPFAAREQVAKLVRHHGLPLWFYEKPDPAHAIISASQSARLDQVADLAEADVRGRICADASALLERVALFRDYAAELDCAITPRSFGSDLARSRYCAGLQSDPDYVPYGDAKCEVGLMSGLPGAGKDTWIAAHLPDWPVISLDAIRSEFGVSPTDPQGTVVQTAKERARVFLRRGQSFVWNATNITRALRDPLIALFTAYHARVRLVYIETPYATLLGRNHARGADALPDAVLHRLITRLDVPERCEAETVTYVVEGESTPAHCSEGGRNRTG